MKKAEEEAYLLCYRKEKEEETTPLPGRK